MQQTDKYKLNLIETPDRFSPDPLNENAQKLEAQLIQADRALADEVKARADADAAEAAARTAAVAAEAKARADAVSAEAKARSDADAAEAKARADAVSAEAKARSDADAAETNARKSADTSEANTRAAADTALDNRIKSLEARKIVIGHYTGNSTAQSVFQEINLGFQPKLVLLRPANTNPVVVTAEVSLSNTVLITTTGFKVCNVSTKGNWNTSGTKYLYLAIL